MKKNIFQHQIDQHHQEVTKSVFFMFLLKADSVKSAFRNKDAICATIRKHKMCFLSSKSIYGKFLPVWFRIFFFFFGRQNLRSHMHK